MASYRSHAATIGAWIDPQTPTGYIPVLITIGTLAQTVSRWPYLSGRDGQRGFLLAQTPPKKLELVPRLDLNPFHHHTSRSTSNPLYEVLLRRDYAVPYLKPFHSLTIAAAIP